MAALYLLDPPPWPDYELLDTGNGAKLERFGSYTLVRPETQAIWPPTLAAHQWECADATFVKTRGSDESPGQWLQHRPLPEQWQLHQNNLHFWVRPTPFRHTGVFPEHSAHWAWLAGLLATRREPNTLVLFGYTGLTSLFLASCGARVTHVDASKPAVRWAQENQQLSKLDHRPIRWLVDDVGKFLARELRRGSRYDLILMDPPVFGRGPRGEIWRLHEQLSGLLQQSARLLSEHPLAVLLNAYATSMSALTLQNVLASALEALPGTTSAGELVLRERQRMRLLPAALYACWCSQDFRHPHEV